MKGLVVELTSYLKKYGDSEIQAELKVERFVSHVRNNDLVTGLRTSNDMSNLLRQAGTEEDRSMQKVLQT